ncbi:MAG: helix-turn-helix transcriptional regulator [Niastella sp.]|nr:helix-turn-helix transcriptional regulator [Niastella sp.]
MKGKNRLGELLDRLKQRKGYTIKRVAELLGGEYSYETLRNEKSKRVPSPYVIKAIEDKFKKELVDEIDKKPVDYPIDDSLDSSIVPREGEVQYGKIHEVLAELKTIRAENKERDSYIKALAEYLVGNTVNGDKQRTKEVLDNLEQVAKKQSTTTDVTKAPPSNNRSDGKKIK